MTDRADQINKLLLDASSEPSPEFVTTVQAMMAKQTKVLHDFCALRPELFVPRPPTEEELAIEAGFKAFGDSILNSARRWWELQVEQTGIVGCRR